MKARNNTISIRLNEDEVEKLIKIRDYLSVGKDRAPEGRYFRRKHAFNDADVIRYMIQKFDVSIRIR